MEEALVARLVAATAITALVGQRVSWFERQRGDALPALTLTKVSPGRDYAHDGADGCDGPRVQIDCWANTDSHALALRNALIAEMEQGAVVGGVTFHPAQLELESWVGEETVDGGERLFRAILDFQFYHEE